MLNMNSLPHDAQEVVLGIGFRRKVLVHGVERVLHDLKHICPEKNHFIDNVYVENKDKVL